MPSFQYMPMEPGAEGILVLYIIISTFCVFMTIRMAFRWKTRKSIPPKLLFFTFLSYSTSIVIMTAGFIEAVLTGEKRELYRFSLAFSHAGFVVSAMLLVLLAMHLFSLKKNVVLPFVVVGLAIAVLVVLPWNYYGMQVGGLAGGSIRPYTTTAMALYSVTINLVILYLTLKVIRRVDDRVGKAGFKLIALSQICLMAFIAFIVADALTYALTDLTGYTPFNYLAWIAAAVFFPCSYLGLIMPTWLRHRLE